jgi:thiol-disulfide isomerase/thioredoxin
LNPWRIFSLLLLFLGSGWVWISRTVEVESAAQRLAQPAVNFPAPEFTLQTLDGQSISLGELRGTPVVLNFWATWCTPCQREMPSLQKSAERYAGAVHILAIDQMEPAEVVQRYMKQRGLTLTVLLDDKGEIGNRYNVKGLPTTYFIDAEGVVRTIHMGEMNSITLAENIRQIWP